MTIEKAYPPNIDEIRAILGEKENTLYCYGDTVYNPSGVKIPADILYHETIHQKQQAQFTSPAIWWQKYLYDTNFRKSQELEAYIEQARAVKTEAPTKVFQEALFEFAYNFATMYKLGIDYSKAETLIRRGLK